MIAESKTTRLVIVEDDECLLASLTAVLASQRDMAVVGSYLSTEEAMEGTDWLAVDVLVTDLSLPGRSGVHLIAAATMQNPHIYSLVHTVHDDREWLFDALRAGATGYMIKGLPVLETLAAVRAVALGTPSLSPSVAHFLIAEFRSRSSTNTEEMLSAREIELLSLSAQGLIYKEIGQKLAISPGTVHSHIKRIYRKLQATSRAQALRRAQSLGYLRAKGQAEV